MRPMTGTVADRLRGARRQRFVGRAAELELFRGALELYRSVPDVAAAGARLAGALRPLDRPALVIWGRHDPYLPAALAERQRDAFPRADVRVLDEAGHWPFVDAHDLVAAAIGDFLSCHAVPGTGAPDRRPHRTKEAQLT
jgi:pimeloyl-ACP methyl ester carboxylesterase